MESWKSRSRSKELRGPSKRDGIHQNRAWEVPQMCEGARARSGRRGRNRRCPGRLLVTISLAREISITLVHSFLP